MCFHLGYRLPQIHAAARPDGLLYPLIDVVFTPTISIFSGRESIQLHVYDFVIHPTTASTATPNNAAAAAAL